MPLWFPLTNLKKLTAKNIQLTSLAAGVLPGNLEELNLAENSKLAQVEENAIVGLAKLAVLDLSDCAVLTTLYPSMTPRI